MTPSTIGTLTYDAAIDGAIADAMREDDSIFVMSTAAPPALLEAFGPDRVRGTPISEPAVSGMAIGAAVTGHRPIVHWRNITFAFNSFDQIANQAAKLRYMLGGQSAVPVVFRATCGGGMRLAAQHSQSPYAVFAHIPGLKVIVPSCAQDAYALMRSAIADDNPVIFLEPARLAAVEQEVDRRLEVPIGSAAISRSGTDLTIVAIGAMVPVAEQAAAALADRGRSAEVVDVRTVSPLDATTIRNSVRRTRILIVADEAPPACSMAAEITATVVEDPDTWRALLTSPRRVCGLPVPIPFSPPLEDLALPGVDQIIEAAEAALRVSAVEPPSITNSARLVKPDSSASR